MKKEKINFPKKVIWSEKRTIADTDINYANHMGNERILMWADDIRNNALNNIGWGMDSLESGSGVIVANHTIVYQSEGFLGDEINIEVGIDYLTEHSFDMVVRLTKENSNKNFIIMRTGVVCFNYNSRKIAEIPEQYLTQLK